MNTTEGNHSNQQSHTVENPKKVKQIANYVCANCITVQVHCQNSPTKQNIDFHDNFIKMYTCFKVEGGGGRLKLGEYYLTLNQ